MLRFGFVLFALLSGANLLASIFVLTNYGDGVLGAWFLGVAAHSFFLAAVLRGMEWIALALEDLEGQ
jgi:hypothetical protein